MRGHWKKFCNNNALERDVIWDRLVNFYVTGTSPEYSLKFEKIYFKTLEECIGKRFTMRGHWKKIFLQEYCHVISHGDDRNKINSILPSEWTVATRQRVTVKKGCRSQRGYQQMLVLSNLRSPDTRGKEGEAKWLAGTLKRKWHLLPVSEKNKNEKLVVWQGS